MATRRGLCKTSFATIACEHIISQEARLVSCWLKDRCKPFMSKKEVYDICSSHILWSVFMFTNGPRYTKKWFWDEYSGAF